MVLPQAVLRSATHGPTLVELKNGDSYSGTLAAVDNLMNIRLEDTIFTPRGSERFERLKECTIRGQFVKFVRFPDNILDFIEEQQEAARAAAALSGKRGRGGGKGGGKGRGRPGGAGAAGATQSIMVPASLVGAIIGRGGETIKRFSEESGARIEVAKDAPEAARERSIHLSGPSECIERAQSLIASLVQERSGLSGGRGGGRPRQRAGPGAQGRSGASSGGQGQGGGGRPRGKPPSS
uniref:U6 snRNA-associated Sm-like protein LSm4 n=1 Tax=Alexandrium monilatum TaxID=311494 RepID=A0A7S4R6Q8_9DINO